MSPVASSRPSRVVAIVGPTASGKSVLAVQLARYWGGEVLSCDSVQIYRGFDVGSAKPRASEQAEVRHHGIDLTTWEDPFDAQRYAQYARGVLEDMRKRRATPIVCGGTGLYLRALRFGLMDTPAADETLRRTLQRREEEEPGVLYRQLEELDVPTAQRTGPNNLVQIVRALEICITTGRRASELRAEHGFRNEQIPMWVFGLRLAPGMHRRRIRARTQQMLNRGLLPEVQGLLASGVHEGCRPMRAVGYRQACEAALGKLSTSELEEEIFKATWTYARRQRTWLRKVRDLQWVDAESTDKAVQQICAAVDTLQRSCDEAARS